MMHSNLASSRGNTLIQSDTYVSLWHVKDQLELLHRKRDIHMAIVVGEFGSVEDMILTGDIIEEVEGNENVGYSFESAVGRHATLP